MSNYLKKANLVIVLMLVISLCLPANVQAAPEARATMSKTSPKNHAENVGPLKVKLTWGSVSNVYQYFYCYYSRDVAVNICDIEDRSTWISNGTSTSVQLPTLMPATKYYWQVAAKLKNNDIVWANGSLTSKWTFTTGTSNVATAGILDDSNTKWVYGGTWAAVSATQAVKGTIHTTSKPGSYAELTFKGARFILTYTGRTNGGLINVLVDGELVDTIDLSSGATAWQQIYRSPLFAEGYHIIRFRHVGADATVINIDAIQIFDAPLSVGYYDDTNGNLFYSGTWTAGKTTSAAFATIHRTSTNGDYAEFIFKGSRFILTYTGRATGASINVIVDGIPIDPAINPIDTYSDTISWQTTWVSPLFTFDTPHTVQLEHTGSGVIDIDAIKIFAPVKTGIYDDAQTNYWVYTGKWTGSKDSQAFRGTYRKTTGVGNAAELVFNGSRFILTYTRRTNGGLIDVLVDESYVDTIDTSAGKTIWQTTWTSKLFTPGIHVVRFEHAGGSTIDIDSIKIIGTPVQARTYDDTNRNWYYTGTWAVVTPVQALGSTTHRTRTSASRAEISFIGSNVTLIFRKSANGGLINVYIDDNLVDTIDAYSATNVWQSTWTYDVPAGPHTVTVEHGGPDGTYIDLDGIKFLP